MQLINRKTGTLHRGQMALWHSNDCADTRQTVCRLLAEDNDVGKKTSFMVFNRRKHSKLVKRLCPRCFKNK